MYLKKNFSPNIPKLTLKKDSFEGGDTVRTLQYSNDKDLFRKNGSKSSSIKPNRLEDNSANSSELSLYQSVGRALGDLTESKQYWKSGREAIEGLKKKSSKLRGFGREARDDRGKGSQESGEAQLEMCKIHNKPLEIICIEPGCMKEICASCALFGDHQGHEVINIEQLKEYLFTVSSKFENVLDELETTKIELENIDYGEKVNILVSQGLRIVNKKIEDDYRRRLKELEELKSKRKRAARARVKEIRNEIFQGILKESGLHTQFIEKVDAWRLLIMKISKLRDHHNQNFTPFGMKADDKASLLNLFKSLQSVPPTREDVSSKKNEIMLEMRNEFQAQKEVFARKIKILNLMDSEGAVDIAGGFQKKGVVKLGRAQSKKSTKFSKNSKNTPNRFGRNAGNKRGLESHRDDEDDLDARLTQIFDKISNESSTSHQEYETDDFDENNNSDNIPPVGFHGMGLRSHQGVDRRERREGLSRNTGFSKSERNVSMQLRDSNLDHDDFAMKLSRCLTPPNNLLKPGELNFSKKMKNRKNKNSRKAISCKPIEPDQSSKTVNSVLRKSANITFSPQKKSKRRKFKKKAIVAKSVNQRSETTTENYLDASKSSEIPQWPQSAYGEWMGENQIFGNNDDFITQSSQIEVRGGMNKPPSYIKINGKGYLSSEKKRLRNNLKQSRKALVEDLRQERPDQYFDKRRKSEIQPQSQLIHQNQFKKGYGDYRSLKQYHSGGEYFGRHPEDTETDRSSIEPQKSQRRHRVNHHPIIFSQNLSSQKSLMSKNSLQSEEYPITASKKAAEMANTKPSRRTIGSEYLQDLADLIEGKLKKFDFSGSEMGDEGVHYISYFVKKYPKRRIWLNLKNCLLTDSGLYFIFSALKLKSRSLEEVYLDLRKNKFSKGSIKQLKKAVQRFSCKIEIRV